MDGGGTEGMNRGRRKLKIGGNNTHERRKERENSFDK